MSDLVDYALKDGVAHIVMDDGKANVMSLAMLQALSHAFRRAAEDEAVVLFRSARTGIFSAGFDLKVFAANDPDASLAMVRAGAELAVQVFSHPTPVVTVCAGHAYPMGAFLVLASDVRIGVDGPWRIGFNEVAIGIAIPSFALELGRHRLQPSWLERTAITGEMIAAADAVQAGFADTMVAPANVDEAIARALARVAGIHRPSHAVTKRRLRGRAIQAMEAAIAAELTPEAYRRRASEPSPVRLPA